MCRMTPHSPWGEACKIRNSPAVYIYYLLFGSIHILFGGGGAKGLFLLGKSSSGREISEFHPGAFFRVF